MSHLTVRPWIDGLLTLVGIVVAIGLQFRLITLQQDATVSSYKVAAGWLGWCMLNSLMFLARQRLVHGRPKPSSRVAGFGTAFAYSAIVAAATWLVYR
jgi:hypothetical protein